MRKNSIKNMRLNNEVAKELGKIIRDEIKDRRVSLMTSITDVYVAPDLKTCKVYVSVLGDEKELEETVLGLNAAKGFIRKELAHSLNLRNTPEITFIGDDSIAYGVNMSKMIDDTLKGKDEEDE